jgi:hypothetical protein
MAPNNRSIAATMQRLEEESWWQTAGSLRPDRTDAGRIVCLGHFLAWLAARDLEITEFTEDRLAEYEASLARFRPGPRAAHARTAREFVRIVDASRPGDASRAGR